MTAARETAARNLRGKTHAHREKVKAPAAVPVPPPPPPDDPTDTVRQTVDLMRSHRRALATWCLDAGMKLGRAQVSTQEVLSALVELVLDDDDVADRARAVIASKPERPRGRPRKVQEDKETK